MAKTYPAWASLNPAQKKLALEKWHDRKDGTADSQWKPRKPTTAEVLKFGTAVAEVKAKTPPAVWKAFVAQSNKKGFTVAGMLSAAPPALRERTARSLRDEAKKTVATAYKPVDAALNDQERKLRALDAKRTTDNQYYMQWLTSENAKINTAARAADTLLGQRAQQIHDDSQSAWAAVQPDALAAMQGASTVSDPNQSSAMADIAAARAKGTGAAENALTENAAIRAAGASQSAMMDRAVLSGANAMESKRHADFQAGISKIFDAKAAAKIDRAKDHISTLGSLKNAELDKASMMQDFVAVAERLGLEREGLTWKKIVEQAKLADADADRNQSAADKAADRAIKEARLEYDRGKADLNKDGVTDAKDLKLKESIEAMYGKKDGKKPPTDGAKKQSATQIGYVSTARGLLVDLNSGVLKPAAGISYRQYLRKRGFNDAQIDVAEDLRKNGVLSGRGLIKAKQLGILHPAKVVW
jgi:hypothetical protein